MKTNLKKTPHVLLGAALLALVAGFSSCATTLDNAQSAKVASSEFITFTLSDSHTLTFSGRITDSNGDNVEITQDLVDIIGDVVNIVEHTKKVVSDEGTTVNQ